MPALPYLTDEEIAGICEGLVMPAAQRRYLATLGLKVFAKPNGKPLVARSEYDRVFPTAEQARRNDEETLMARLASECSARAGHNSYEGSPLQRYHQQKNADGIARAEHAETQRLAEIADRKARPAHYRALKKQAAKLAAEARAGLVRHHAAKRRVAKLQRTAPWADQQAIAVIYREALRLTEATGVVHHVDHEIPLQGKYVSGLHVENNLQILTASDNIRKRNRFEVE